MTQTTSPAPFTSPANLAADIETRFVAYGLGAVLATIEGRFAATDEILDHMAAQIKNLGYFDIDTTRASEILAGTLDALVFHSNQKVVAA